MQLRPWHLVLLAAALASAAPAQTNSAGPPVVNFSDGGANPSGIGPMESIFIPPLAGAPFDLQLAAEWSRPMAGGGSFTLANQRRIVRDSRGRIYQERWILVPKGGNIKSHMNVFQITDPDQHTWYNCSPQSKVCELLPYHLTTAMKYRPRIGTSGPLADGRGYSQNDDLGVDAIQGLEAHGYRETITYNPGTMGNDQPMTATREFWFSLRLGINLSSTVDNPQTGKQVFAVKDLSTSEPDPAIFQVPAEYHILDHRANADQPNIVPNHP